MHKVEQATANNNQVVVVPHGVDQGELEVTHEHDFPVPDGGAFKCGKLFNHAKKLDIGLLIFPIHKTEKNGKGDVVFHRGVENVQL